VSGAAGFSIEIRERYRDVAGDRWPVTPGPEPDELASIWLHRLAIVNGIAPRAFGEVLGLGGGMWSSRLDVHLPDAVAARLGARTGVARATISAMATTNGALAPLLLPLRATARRNRSTWLQYCASCLADDRTPYFRRSWRLASRISCFRHGCGLRDRCPACRGGVAPFAQTELVAQHVCVHCGFDLRDAARVSVTVAARRLERAIDDLCSAGPADGSSRIEALVASLLRAPVVAGGSSLLLTNLSAAVRIRCFEQLARRGGDGPIAQFVDFGGEGRGPSPNAPVHPRGADLADLLGAYVRVTAGGSRSKVDDDRDAVTGRSTPETVRGPSSRAGQVRSQDRGRRGA